MPFDPDRQAPTTSSRAKQLIVLAADLVLGDVAKADAHRLVGSRILPACYRRRYDGSFLESFGNVCAQSRNVLVGDLPFLGSTASELAGNAIFAAAHRALERRGPQTLERAEAIDPELAGEITTNAYALGDEIDDLVSVTIPDADVLSLFDVPADQEPDEHLTASEGSEAWWFLRFENWFRPFPGAPRPHITYDGRAWPIEP